MIDFRKLSVSVIILATCLLKLVQGFAPLYTWTEIDYLYPNPEFKEFHIANGIYMAKNCIPIDVDATYLRNGPSAIRMIFVTIPRFKAGVPASLGTIFERTQKDTKDPLIAPFPRWEWHQNPQLCNENRLVSVIRIQIDQCGRLWVLDSGRISGQQICPPQVLVFQMANYVLLRKYEIPSEQYEDHSLFVTIAVESLDPEGACSKTPFAYIADSRDNALIVYSYVQNESWKIKHKSFSPLSGLQHFSRDDRLYSIDGLTGLAVGSPDKRKLFLYYYPLASNEQSRVETKFLKNKHKFVNNANLCPNEFETFPNGINVQRSAAAFSSKGNLYFCSITDSSIKYWRAQYQFTANNVLTMIQNNGTLQYPSGLKIIKRPKGREELYVLSNRLQNIVNGSFNKSEVNFRIMYERYM